MLHVEVTIAPVLGGFIVTYPRAVAGTGLEIVKEVATTPGKAIRIAKAAVEAFSLVKKDDTEA